MQPMTVYAYGVARNRMQQAGRRLHVPLSLTDDFNRADAIVTLKNYYRRRPKLIVDAERRGVPIYVLRANTVTQMENFLTDVFQLEDPASSGDSYNQAMRETEDAIHRIVAGEDTIDLMPQSSDIRRLQHEMARKANLLSESHGKEPQRRVRLLREA
jgi:protein-tyrosine-phosphatase